MIHPRSFRNLSLAVAAAALASGGALSAAPPGGSPQPAPGLSRSDPRGPLIQAGLAPGGRCAYLFDGRAVAETGLLEAAVDHVESLIGRLGGVENVTAANFPAANFEFSGDVPYRCVGQALETIGSAGFFEFRIADPNPAAAPWAGPMMFELHPPHQPGASADEVRNRVDLDDRGSLSWNGDKIDLVRLRQYFDITQTMDPIPWLELEIAERAPYREVGAILGILWRARVQQIEMSGPGGRRSGLRLSAASIDP